MEIIVAQNILKANDQIASANRRRLDEHGIYCINLLGSPGAGKTALLEALAPRLRPELRLGVIEGDLATSRDADRIEKLGLPVVQINTGGACHLDAGMVGSALDKLELKKIDLMFIENVGNLVCPASYRLGEDLRIVVLSVAEGDDKVAKYPTMFGRVDLVVINKSDLLPHVDFKMDKVLSDGRVVAPEVKFFSLSARDGAGVEELAAYLLERIKNRHE